MGTKRKDHRTVFITAARNPVEPIVLLESEWLILQDALHTDQNKDQKLSANTRSRLLKVTNIYASSWRDPKSSTQPLKAICKEIDAWRIKTARLRNIIWKKPTDKKSREESYRSKLKEKFKNEELDLDDIIERYFNRGPSQLQINYPLARFDRLLKGAIFIGDYTVEKLFQEAKFERETKLWFVWAAAVLAILSLAHIPVKHPRRKQLLNGPVKVLERLQSKLPIDLQRRRTQDSLRKGAVNAYKIRQGNQIDLMQRLLTRWAKNNFDNKLGPNPTRRKFLIRLSHQTTKATKIRPKRTQTV
jgi:hypothetical protein